VSAEELQVKSESSLPRGAAPLTVTAIVLSLVSTILWGGVSVASLVASDRLPPMALATLRFALATLFMWAWCRIEGTSISVRRGQWKPIWIMGGYLALQIGTFQIGTAWSTTSHSTLLVNTYVFWVAFIETWILKTFRMTPRQTFGLFVAAAGVVLLIATDRTAGASAQDQPTLTGDLVLAFSALIFGLMTIQTKPALQVIDAAPLIFWRNLVATAMMGAVSLGTENVAATVWDTRTVVAVLYAGLVVSGFCFTLQVWLLRRFSASQISVFSFATPISGVAFGVLIRNDTLSPWLLISGACVALGIALVNAPVGRVSPRPTANVKAVSN
jgi:drug/metabolite transporter (DMT)-like permease